MNIPLEDPEKYCMNPVCSAGIEHEFEPMTNIGILVANVYVKYVDSSADMFNEEKGGIKYESDDISDLFSGVSKQNLEWSHDMTINDIDSVNWTNH